MSDIQDIELNQIENVIVMENEPMKKHTTLRVGGEARYLVEIGDLHGLKHTLEWAKVRGLPYYVMGNGSNILVSDRGFPGVIVKIGHKLGKISLGGEYISAQGGASLAEVSRIAAATSLSGLEFASGIPGTVGGAMVMNAGAFGGDMSQVVESVLVCDIKSRKCLTLTNKEMEFGYRRSIIKDSRYIVLKAEFKLEKGEIHDIKNKSRELLEKRNEKQPLQFPSAGSTFKRPEGYFAGELIEKTGLKGLTIGGAQVSEKHAGFIINKDNASAEDIYNLIREVQERVLAKTGVNLETEVVLLGDFE